MTKNLLGVVAFLLFSLFSFCQPGWKITNSPTFNNRVDDIFMVNTQVGYAVSGDGRIVKSTDGGENWIELLRNNTVYCRAVEFINTTKGFVGAFPVAGIYNNILRRTTDGGMTWTDLTPLLHQRARRGGICGLAIPDSNTIYGGGNWFQDSAYIVKSTDGGNSWSFIDMSSSPTAQTLDLVNVERADEPRPSAPLEEVLRNAPRREGGYLRVRAVLE